MFISNIWVNILICLSFRNSNIDKHSVQWTYFHEITWTEKLIKISGIVNLVLTGLIIWNFVLKRAPLIFKDVWEGYPPEIKAGCFCKMMVTVCQFISRFIKSLVMCLFDLTFLYYVIYIGVCILGLILHPFFFMF